MATDGNDAAGSTDSGTRRGSGEVQPLTAELYALAKGPALERAIADELRARGWRDGDAATPNTVALVPHCRREVAGVTVPTALLHELVPALRERWPRFGFRHRDRLEQWRHGESTIRLGGNTGHYFGEAWEDVLAASSPSLPASLVELLRAQRTAEFAEQLLDHLYGKAERVGSRRPMYFAFTRSNDSLLVRFFTRVRELARARGRVPVPGLATVFAQPGEVTAITAPAVSSFLQGRDDLGLQPVPGLDEFPLADVERRLGTALRTLSPASDLIFGDALAMHMIESPTVRTTNRRTGRTIEARGKRIVQLVFAPIP
jgi:hypothetical protein